MTHYTAAVIQAAVVAFAHFAAPSLRCLYRLQELLRAPGVEEKLLADPTTHVAMLSSLGGAYLMLWKACREEPSGGGTPRGGRTDTRESLEFRIDLSAPRMELLHQAQRFLGEALTAPENFNDPVIRAQLGESTTNCVSSTSVRSVCKKRLHYYYMYGKGAVAIFSFCQATYKTSYYLFAMEET